MWRYNYLNKISYFFESIRVALRTLCKVWDLFYTLLLFFSIFLLIFEHLSFLLLLWFGFLAY